MAGVAATAADGGGRTTAMLAYETARAAIADAGLENRDIPAVFLGPGGGGPPSADAVAVRLGLRRLGFGRAPRVRRGGRAARSQIEHVSPSGVEALHRACQAIELGMFDLVLCVGAEQDGAVASGTNGAVWPPPELLRDRSDAARRYMTASRATVEQLARVGAKNHTNGVGNPRVRVPAGSGAGSAAVSAQDVLDSEALAWPLTRLMVAPRGAGAAAVVLCSAAAARRIGVRGPCVRGALLVAAGAEEEDCTRAGGAAGLLGRGRRPGGPRAARSCSDVTAAAELAAYEALQLAPEGQGPELIDSGFTALGGVLPVNASGGLLSLGELPGVAGISQLCELTWQLRGKAGARQVAGARVGLAHAAGQAADGALVAVTVVVGD